MKNSTFEKALALLAHPYSLMMLALLLINDAILQPLWPSWWTGKLGDIAWLGFVPFLLAAVLVWIPPLREASRQNWVRWLAFGLTASVFTLFKTLPAFHALTVHVFELLFGAPAILVRDPSDLLALPVLLVGWHLWEQPLKDKVRTRSIRGLVLVPLAALLLLADAAAPDYGILCLDNQEGRIYANASYSYYTSGDGGLTWQSSTHISDYHCANAFSSPQTGEWQEVKSEKTGIIYRYQSGQTIQSSSDGGTNWQEAHKPVLPTSAVSAYRIKISTGNPIYTPGPLDAIEDPSTGNVIFAMGHEGLLVRTAEGGWVQSPAGNYRPLPSTPDFSMLQVLLGDQLILALLGGLLIYTILAVPRLHLSKKWMPIILWVLVVIAALVWLVVALIYPPAESGYIYAFVALGLLFVAILLVVMALALSIDLFRSPLERLVMLKMALWSLGGALLFFLPSLLWAYNILPQPGWVVAISLLWVVVVIAAAFWMLPHSRKTP